MSKKGGPKHPKDEIKYEVNEIVLGKLRGFPAWPGQVVDPDTVRPDVAKDRPKKSNFYCIRFFPAGDHAWLNTKDLSKLKTHEIEAYINEPHKKNGDLLTGYRIALDPSKWEEEMAKKQEAAEEANANAEVDELDAEEDDDDDGDDDEKPKAKKRKRDSEGANKAKSKVKKDKGKTDVAPKKKSAPEKTDKSAKNKKNGPKSKLMVESEDEGGRADDAGPSKKAAQPPTKKAKREKSDKEDDNLENDPDAVKVKDMRHRLQRAFLGKVPPKDEDMPSLDSLFSSIEQYDISLKYLQFSKIGKVMRHIAALKGPVPRDDEFRFKDRAQALVNKWQVTINSGSEKPATGDTTKPGDDNLTLQGPFPTDAATLAPESTLNGKDANGTGELSVNGDVASKANGPFAAGDITMADSTIADVTMSEA